MFPPRAPFFLAVSGPAMAGLPPGEARLRPQPSATTLCNRLLLAHPSANLEPPRFNRKCPCNSVLLGLSDGTAERVEMALAEEDETDELDRWALRFPRGRYCDRGGQLDRIAVDARRDRRERDARATEPRGHLEGPAVARRQELRLAGLSPAPDRADGVD